MMQHLKKYLTMTTDSLYKIIKYAIYMSEHTYGSIRENVDELLEDLSGSDTANIVNQIYNNLPTERSHEFIRRQWVIELRKLEQSL